MDNWSRIRQQAGSAPTRTGSSLPAPGTVIMANVEEDLGEGVYALRWAGNRISVVSRAVLTPGQSLILKSETSPEGKPTLVVQGPALPDRGAVSGRVVYGPGSRGGQGGAAVSPAAAPAAQPVGGEVAAGVIKAVPTPNPQPVQSLLGLVLEPLGDLDADIETLLAAAAEEKDKWKNPPGEKASDKPADKSAPGRTAAEEAASPTAAGSRRDGSAAAIPAADRAAAAPRPGAEAVPAGDGRTPVPAPAAPAPAAPAIRPGEVIPPPPAVETTVDARPETKPAQPSDARPAPPPDRQAPPSSASSPPPPAADRPADTSRPPASGREAAGAQVPPPPGGETASVATDRTPSPAASAPPPDTLAAEPPGRPAPTPEVSVAPPREYVRPAPLPAEAAPAEPNAPAPPSRPVGETPPPSAGTPVVEGRNAQPPPTAPESAAQAKSAPETASQASPAVASPERNAPQSAPPAAAPAADGAPAPAATNDGAPVQADAEIDVARAQAFIKDALTQLVKAAELPLASPSADSQSLGVSGKMPEAIVDKAAGILLRAAGLSPDAATMEVARALVDNNVQVDRPTVQAMLAITAGAPEADREALLQAAARLSAKDIPLATPLASGLADVMNRTASAYELMDRAAASLATDTLDPAHPAAAAVKPLLDSARDLLAMLHVDLGSADAASVLERYLSTFGREALGKTLAMVEKAAQAVLENHPLLPKIDQSLTAILKLLEVEIAKSEGAVAAPAGPAQTPAAPGEAAARPAPGTPSAQPETSAPATSAQPAPAAPGQAGSAAGGQLPTAPPAASTATAEPAPRPAAPQTPPDAGPRPAQPTDIDAPRVPPQSPINAYLRAPKAFPGLDALNLPPMPKVVTLRNTAPGAVPAPAAPLPGEPSAPAQTLPGQPAAPAQALPGQPSVPVPGTAGEAGQANVPGDSVPPESGTPTPGAAQVPAEGRQRPQVLPGMPQGEAVGAGDSGPAAQRPAPAESLPPTQPGSGQPPPAAVPSAPTAPATPLPEVIAPGMTAVRPDAPPPEAGGPETRPAAPAPSEAAPPPTASGREAPPLAERPAQGSETRGEAEAPAEKTRVADGEASTREARPSADVQRQIRDAVLMKLESIFQTPGLNRPEFELLRPSGVLDRFLREAPESGKKNGEPTENKAAQLVRDLLSNDPEKTRQTLRELPRQEPSVLKETASRLTRMEAEIVRSETLLGRLSDTANTLRDLGRQMLAVKAENVAGQERDPGVMLADVPFKLNEDGGNGRMQMFYRRSKGKQGGWSSRVILDLNTTSMGPVLGDMRFFGQDMMVNMFVEKTETATFLGKAGDELVAGLEKKGFRVKTRFMVLPPPPPPPELRAERPEITGENAAIAADDAPNPTGTRRKGRLDVKG